MTLTPFESFATVAIIVAIVVVIYDELATRRERRQLQREETLRRLYRASQVWQNARD